MQNAIARLKTNPYYQKISAEIRDEFHRELNLVNSLHDIHCDFHQKMHAISTLYNIYKSDKKIIYLVDRFLTDTCASYLVSLFLFKHRRIIFTTINWADLLNPNLHYDQFAFDLVINVPNKFLTIDKYIIYDVKDENEYYRCFRFRNKYKDSEITSFEYAVKPMIYRVQMDIQIAKCFVKRSKRQFNVVYGIYNNRQILFESHLLCYLFRNHSYDMHDISRINRAYEKPHHTDIRGIHLVKQQCMQMNNYSRQILKLHQFLIDRMQYCRLVKFVHKLGTRLLIHTK